MADRSAPIITREELLAQLEAMGITSGDVLLVHTSFREVRPVEGGPTGLIEALIGAIGPGGTLVMPTMTDGESVFDPQRTPTSDMGIVAETFWRRPDTIRSTHPAGSFAARGPLAHVICAPQPLSPPHGPDSPVGRAHDHDAKILLLGVHHSENTTIHLAEAIANVPYFIAHPCVVGAVRGEPEVALIPETDHCCENFKRVDVWLNSAQNQVIAKVGHATARLCSARDVVQAVVEKLRAEPLLFLCEQGTGCDECDLARSNIPG